MELLIGIILALIVLVLLYCAILFFNMVTYLGGVTEGERIDGKTMSNSALLVIDMQNAYVRLDGGKRPATPELAGVVSSINKTIDHFSGQGKEVVFIAQVKEKTALRSFFMPQVPVAGTEKAGISPALNATDPVIITKPRGDAFSNPELRRYLDEKGVGKLYVTGIAAEFCVNYTIQGALNRGYDVYAVRDAIIAVMGDKSKEKMLQKHANLGAKIVSADAL